jgi:hypothetical protein
MTTPSRSFRRAVAQKKGKDAPRPVVEFFLEWLDDEAVDEDGNPVVHRRDVFHATQPTDERIFLIAALAGDEDAGASAEAAAIMDLFKTSLPEDEYKILRQRLKDPEDDVDLTMLQEVVPWLMEEWSAFPTVPASASLESPPSTGVRSTGRAPGKGSTRSTTT